jgi:DNA polymerase-2
VRHRGFILQPTYRIEAGRPVVHLFGRLENGDPFLLRDARLVPYFFVRASDAALAREAGASRLAPTDLHTMRGEPVVRVEIPTPPAAVPLRDALRARGVPALEADIRYAMRFLIDRGIRGALAIEDGAPNGGGLDRAESGEGGPGGAAFRVFEDPEAGPGDWEPAPGTLKVLSLDIETDPAGKRVHAAALAGAGVEETFVALPAAEVETKLRDSSVAGQAVGCGDERGLLTALMRRMQGIDFDILTGWNVIDFDLAVLAAASTRCGVPFEVGRVPGPVRVIRDRSSWGRSRAEIPGRVVLDGIELLKGAFVKLQDYRLETAAREILGEGKLALEAGGGSGRAEAIERALREDLPRFVEYNLRDAQLVLGILDRAGLVDLAVRRSLLTGMPLDRVGASIASFDFLYLHELRRRGYVAPSVGAEPEEIAPTLGGAVLEPTPGLHDNVLAFDFKSLYPSLVRTFNIDPLGYVPEPDPREAPDLIRAPNGACFRREPGILPEMVATLFPRRDAAKRRGDAIGAHALKILMNSFYGVLATPACRFYSAPVANAITHFGQWALRWARDQVEAWGHRVLYGDTDSLFVTSGVERESDKTGAAGDAGAAARAGADGRESARRLGVELCGRVNDALRAHIRERFGLESHLELEFEALYARFFLPAVRHGSAGARKRYAGLLVSPPGPDGPGREEVVFVGMEVVRRDWTELSKIFQRGLFERLFRGASKEAVAEYLRGFVRDLREGRHDDHLVYRKALRKELRDYTATTPPHVQAARKLGRSVSGIIEYVVTTAGPEPASRRTGAIDYEHYVLKQIRPIAEQVLPLLGLGFEEAAGGGVQGRLF